MLCEVVSNFPLQIRKNKQISIKKKCILKVCIYKINDSFLFRNFSFLSMRLFHFSNVSVYSISVLVPEIIYFLNNFCFYFKLFSAQRLFENMNEIRIAKSSFEKLIERKNNVESEEKCNK